MNTYGHIHTQAQEWQLAVRYILISEMLEYEKMLTPESMIFGTRVSS